MVTYDEILILPAESCRCRLWRVGRRLPRRGLSYIALSDVPRWVGPRAAGGTVANRTSRPGEWERQRVGADTGCRRHPVTISVMQRRQEGRPSDRCHLRHRHRTRESGAHTEVTSRELISLGVHAWAFIFFLLSTCPAVLFSRIVELLSAYTYYFCPSLPGTGQFSRGWL